MKQNKVFFNKKSLSQYTTKPKNQTNLTPKPSHKKLKIFAGTSLALFMGISTLCGVFLSPTSATTATTTPTNSTTTQPQTTGLITPQKDDPVLFTTETGLEIKFGNSLTGNLSGFPYFITNDGAQDYYWVIIGEAEDCSYQNALLSSFRDPTKFEKDTPAGTAIAGSNGLHILLSKAVKTNPEIPTKSVLCILNDIVATGAFNTIRGISSTYTSQHAVTYHGTENIAVAMEGYYTNKNFGIDRIYNFIQAVTLKSYGSITAPQYELQESVLESQHIFPLASSSSQTFYYANYLETVQMKLSQGQWLRGAAQAYVGGFSQSGGHIYALGNIITSEGVFGTATCNNQFGYRPALCVKLTNSVI